MWCLMCYLEAFSEEKIIYENMKAIVFISFFFNFMFFLHNFFIHLIFFYILNFFRMISILVEMMEL
jgi:hypothetical protein